MAQSALCVSCVQLPQKDRALAVRTQECPDCNNLFGITSYGAAFRIKAVKRRQWLTPSLATGMAVGAALFMLVVTLVGIGLWSKEQVLTSKRRPDPAPATELAQVPQVAIEDPMAPNVSPAFAKQHIADLVKEIKAENGNGQNRDQFLFKLMKRRPETRGLPFVMGNACRMDSNKSQSFQTNVEAVRRSLDADSPRSQMHGTLDDSHAQFWNTYSVMTGATGTNTDPGIAALTQMIAPERAALRKTLVQRLVQSNRPDATRALARAAVFDRDSDVRDLAIAQLKNRPGEPSKETTEILLHGLRYPMVNVAKQASLAVLALDRKDLLPELVAMLDEPAPGDPVADAKDKNACTVREVVRINHHRNCLLCHPPSGTGQPVEVPGVIPTPGLPFAPSASEAYGSAQSMGDPMVRADTTYLRQDFSMMMPVANAAPWPEMQRFDFLVRTRVVEGAELDVLKQRVEARGNAPTDHQRTVHVLLKQMTGQDAAPNTTAWKRVLGIGQAD